MNVSNCLWKYSEGHEWFSDDSPGRQEIFMCLAALLAFANVGAKISIKSCFMRSFFSQCIQQQWSASQNFFGSIRSKLPPAACWSREKKKENCEANLLYVESDFGITDTTDKSFTVFFARWVLTLILESKSQPVELESSTIELHVPSVKAKEKLAIIPFCGLWFPSFNAIWYDLWGHVAWRLKFR